MPHLSTTEAAERLGVTRQHVVYLIQNGELKATRVGRAYVIDTRAVEAFSKRDRPGPGRPPKPKE